MARWKLWLELGLLLGAFAWLSTNAHAWAPTMDEQNHVARGYVFLRTADPRLSSEHPPLINSLEALPLLMLADVRLPTDDWSWQVGEWYRFADLFLWEVNHDVERMIYLARLPVIGLTLLLASLVARWAGELWGQSGALLGLTLVTLDPNLLAHGGLATTDMGQALAVFTAGYAVWRATQAPSWQAFALTGLAMGAMLASKVSALAFAGVFGALLVGDAARRVIDPQGLLRSSGSPPLRSGAILKRLLAVVGVVAIALLALWAVYAFELAPVVEGGPAWPLGTYWKGLLSIFEQVQGGRPSYMLGRTSIHGWWIYFPLAFAVKTPLPTLGLLLLAIPAALASRRWRAQAFLLVPVLAYWALAMQSALNLGYRHLLPTLPFLYVWAGQLAEASLPFKLPLPRISLPTSYSLLPAKRSYFLLPILCLWLLVETVSIAPHFLSYFNPLGGGPANGWKILADSNIDWGQDLKALRAYVRANPSTKIKLSWFGSSYPEAYGIDYEPLPGLPHHFDLWAKPPFDPQQPEPGLYAISVSNLVEIPFEDKWVFAYFRARAPDERIGYSIYLYRIDP
ncbi:MAG: glycosyltransferase family 39 protein [Thermoflexales bacterium]|nr:glycosyltransferase family 39 protein [Thermoflexales bacterium]